MGAVGTSGWTVTWEIDGVNNLAQQVTLSLDVRAAEHDTTHTGVIEKASDFITGAYVWRGSFTCNMDETTGVPLPGQSAPLTMTRGTRRFSGTAFLTQMVVGIDPDQGVVTMTVNFLGTSELTL